MFKVFVILENISLVEKVVGKNAEVVGTVNHPRQRTNLKIRKKLRVSRHESTELEHTGSGISDKMLTKVLVPSVVDRHRFDADPNLSFHFDADMEKNPNFLKVLFTAMAPYIQAPRIRQALDADPKPGSGKMMPIRPNTDPQHCLYQPSANIY